MEEKDLQLVFQRVQKASRVVACLSSETIVRILHALADAVEQSIPMLLAENLKDLERMEPSNPKYDRLLLSESRLLSITGDMRKVAGLPNPLGKILEDRILENGMHLQKVTVPLGVVGIIYEARPNVTFDVFALCLKSGNACILKGGSDAEFSNVAIVGLIQSVLKSLNIDENIVALLPADRTATEALLHAVSYVDVLIPRGSQGLIDYVRDHAKVPVIETGAGIVHAYMDASASVEKTKNIVFNSKTRRVSVCNALDCLLVHHMQLSNLYKVVAPMAEKSVQIYANETAYAALENDYPTDLLFKADEKAFGTEFLDYKMAIKTVQSIEEAIEHISQFGSKHSETILAEDEQAIEKFLFEIDAAAVYANVSTAFTDGGQFGMGAEIGISTQKLHARGPMALPELCSYKWLIRGNGQVRA
jgi:glutamate-5-semialdehyde dehydrogenase